MRIERWANRTSPIEDVERAAKENGNSVAKTFEIVTATVDKDRSEHAQEYQAERPVA